MRKPFLRRSLLYVPGSSLRMIEKSLGVAADSLIFDLEDAVSLQEKDNARRNVVEVIHRAKETDKEVIVRINAASSYLGIRDLLEVVPQRPDTIIVPKADEASIVTADTMISAIEHEFHWESGTLRLVPLMETSDSIVNAARIVGAGPRIDGLQFGAEDLTKELGIVRTAQGDELQYARSVLVFAGRARGIDIIDSPFVDHSDIVGLTTETRRVKALGMTGKTCIHPAQVDTVNTLFTPAADEVEKARRIIEAFEEALKLGKGACSLDGKMIDNPIAERARHVLMKAERIHARQQSDVA